MRLGPGLAALAVAAVATGCGSSAGQPRATGRALFAEDCAVCHSLTGHASPRQQGGDLLGFQMTRAQMLEFVREMPVPHPLSSDQQETVADYVRSAESQGP
ncbi:MAG: cytochrome c [Solirubrobacterales bacterium]|nr:cytochrome c [Solirubrobacterales bacterium]